MEFFEKLFDIISETVVCDLAALMLLISVMTFTALYRRRNRLSDRLFFYMCLCNLAFALFDGINAALNNITPNRIADLILVQTNIFRSISLLALCATVIFYLTSIRIRGPVLPIFSGLIVCILVFRAIMPGTSATAFISAVGLVFAHVCEMNNSYYYENKKETDQ